MSGTNIYILEIAKLFLPILFKVIENKEGFLPYSTGKRACPGAKVASIFIIFLVFNVHHHY